MERKPNKGIYKRVSPDQKIYIGGSADLKRRKEEHKNWQTNMICQVPLLFEAYKLHGEETFSWEVLVANDSFDKKTLQNLERLFIRFYERQGHETLNILGSTKNKPKERLVGVRDRIVRPQFVHSGERTIKPKRHKGRNKRKVVIYDTTGNKINEYSSIREAARAYNVSVGAFVRHCSQDINFRIEKKKTTKISKAKENGQFHEKAIIQYDKQNFIAEFRSTVEAGQSVNVNIGNISSCANGRLKTAGGFVWRWK